MSLAACPRRAGIGEARPVQCNTACDRVTMAMLSTKGKFALRKGEEGASQLLPTLRLLPAGGLAARSGACRRIVGLRHDRRSEESRHECVVLNGWAARGDRWSVAMIEHAVVIGGGGPTGLMLAGELALAGVDVAIVERRASQELAGSRASGLHARTIEVLDQRGIADRFVSQGQTHPAVHFHVPLDITDGPTRHNYVLALWQNHIERTLAEWVGELRVPIYRGRDVTGFAQDDTGVDVALSDGQALRADYLVGCDGGRSVIRKSRRHRVRRMGSDNELADCRSGDGPGADVGISPRCRRHPCDRPGGHSQFSAHRADREAAAPRQRTHPAGTP